MRERLKHLDQPKLCPRCPLRHLEDIARKRLIEKQYTRKKDEPTNLRLCMEMRALAREHGMQPCHYFPRSEDIGFYAGMYGIPVEAKSAKSGGLDDWV